MLTSEYKCEQCNNKVDVLYFDKEEKIWRCQKCTRYLNKEPIPLSHRINRPTGLVEAHRGI